MALRANEAIAAGRGWWGSIPQKLTFIITRKRRDNDTNNNEKFKTFYFEKSSTMSCFKSHLASLNIGQYHIRKTK